MKLRPVLLLTAPVGIVPELLVASISSALPSVPLASDILLDPTQPEHAGTNLKNTSVLRLHRLATIHESSVKRYLGQLSAATWTEVGNKPRLLLNLGKAERPIKLVHLFSSV